MAIRKGVTDALRGLPKGVPPAVARRIADLNLQSIGALNILTKGTPLPEEFVVSVLPKSGEAAAHLVNALLTKPAYSRFEVFPYGILNPEIGRIDVSFTAER